MSQRIVFSGWLRVATYLLEPSDVARIIEPTIADALHERASIKSARTWLWRSRFHLASATSGALHQCAILRLKGSSWLGFFALLLAGLSGAASLRQQGPVAAFALSQCAFVGIAAAVGLVIVTAPAKPLRSLGTVALLLAVAALAACPWYGVAYDGQRQWLKLGPLQIHAATLLLPVFAVFVQRAASERRHVRLAVGTLVALGLLLLQPNGQAALVYLLTLGVALLERRARWSYWLMAGLLGIAAVASVVKASAISVWPLLGLAALVLSIGWGIYAGLARRQSGSSSTQTLTMAMVALMALRGLDGDTLPVVGFGGSAIVAFFVLMALQMRSNEAVTTGSIHHH